MLPGQQPHELSMQRILLCALLCAASLSAVAPAFAWMSEPARNPDNGHFYAFFNGADDDRFIRPAMPFADALTRAESKSHLGVPGHLATITSQAEQSFVSEYFLELSRASSPIRFSRAELFWIAASDAAVEGEWRWVAGPEAGQQFWQGDRYGVAIGYQNWDSHHGLFYEPNNAHLLDGEDFVALNLNLIRISQVISWWNDVSTRDDTTIFVPRMGLVEFSVPEPSSATLTAGAGLMLVAACRRRGKSEVPR